jgi:anhydro-N-acetylmuramic acid kinase
MFDDARSLRVVGLISGTSADGIDAAYVTIRPADDGVNLDVIRAITVPLSVNVRDAVLSMARNEGEIRSLARWHVRLGEEFAEAAATLLSHDTADVIGSHGQTVAHMIQDGKALSSLQIGSAPVIAEYTGIPVIHDFRSGDVAAGGQGAPLVPLLDITCLRHDWHHRVALNIGGMANVTYIPPRSSQHVPVAFDTGPGNALIDRASWLLSEGEEPYDRDGAGAATGSVDEAELRKLLQSPYFSQPPPKSTGRELFGDELAADTVRRLKDNGATGADILATLTEFTVSSVAAALKFLPQVDEVFVSGGGVHNRAVMEGLRRALAGVHVQPSDAAGIPADFKEAIAFALLADRTMRGLPGNVPSCNGARHPVVLGSLVSPHGLKRFFEGAGR